MAKGRVSAQQLKRDPLMEQYVNTSHWVKDRSQTLRRWLLIIVGVIAAALIVWFLISRNANQAAAAMAEAYKYENALVANPIPPNASGYVFTSDEQKHRKAYEAFEKAANDYPSRNGEIGHYLAATHQLFFEPDKAEATLKDLSQKDSEVGSQARLALVNRYVATEKNDAALAELQKLKAKPFNVPAQFIDFNLARIYESTGKTKEAIDLYFGIANNKEWRNTALGNECVEHLSLLAPDKVDQLPPPERANPFGGMRGLF